MCLIFAQFLLISCSIEKRVYRKGYYVLWNHKGSSENERIKKAHSKDPGLKYGRNEEDVRIYASNGPRALPITPKERLYALLKNEPLNDGELLKPIRSSDENRIHKSESSIRAEEVVSSKHLKTTNIKSTTVAYSNLLKNGLSRRFDLNQGPTQKAKSFRSSKTGKMNLLGLLSLLSLLVWITGMVIFLVVTLSFSGLLFISLSLLVSIPIVLAYVSLFQFKRDPGKYTGRWMPMAVLIFLLAILFYLTVVGAILLLEGWLSEYLFIISLVLSITLLSIFISALSN